MLATEVILWEVPLDQMCLTRVSNVVYQPIMSIPCQILSDFACLVNPFPRVGSNRRIARPVSSGSELSGTPEVPKRPSVPADRPKRPSSRPSSILKPVQEPVKEPASSDEGEDIKLQPSSTMHSTPPVSSEPPVLLSLSPKSGSPDGM